MAMEKDKVIKLSVAGLALLVGAFLIARTLGVFEALSPTPAPPPLEQRISEEQKKALAEPPPPELIKRTQSTGGS
jgi:hypothetical protein